MNKWVENSVVATQTYDDIQDWCMDLVTNTIILFFELSFNEDLSSWNVAAVTSMHGMFANPPLMETCRHRM